MSDKAIKTNCVIQTIPTPAPLIEVADLEHNLRIMSDCLSGARLRPHVKAHKCTQLARRQYESGHHGFTCATLREMEGMIAVGLGDDLLLANQTLDVDRLQRLNGRGLVAVDSVETIEVAAKGLVGGVLIEVNVGLNRCGCVVADAGRLAELARNSGLEVRGVMGYEGHAAHVHDATERQHLTSIAMQLLDKAHQQVGGDIVSAGSTGTYHCNTVATEIQAGSYALMDNEYARLNLPFRQAFSLLATVIATTQGRVVIDCGLKAMGMDAGLPIIANATVHQVHDEHTIFQSEHKLRVGDRVRVYPTHIDPTMAYHDRVYVIDSERVLDIWPIDLRGWG